MVKLPKNFNCILDKCQQTLLAVMSKMEVDPSIRVGDNNMVMTSNKAMVYEKLSVGKTLAMAALIADTVDDPVRSDTYNYSGYWYSTCTYQCFNHLICTMEQIDMTVVPWTIILTNTSGVSSYEYHLKKCSKIKIFKIDVPADIVTLVNVLTAKIYNLYNVIIIKTKSVNESTLLRDFRIATEGIKFKRFVVDNFNDLKLSYQDTFIPADFTWIIGKQVRKSTGTIRSIVNSQIDRYFKDDYYNNPILQICKDENIQRFYTIRFDSNFIKSYYELPMVKSYTIIVQNKNNIFKHQNVLNDSLTKMINEQNIVQLAKELGISCDSIGALHYLLLESSKGQAKVSGWSDEYIKISRALSFIDNIRTVDLTDSKNNSSLIKQLYQFVQPNKKIPMRIKSDKVKTVCNKLELELIDRKHKLLNPYQRLHDNLHDYECQCCYVPFDDLDNHVFILHCCQILLCVDCIFINRSRLINKCPKCVHPIKSIQNISYINFEINLIRSNKTIIENDLIYNTVITKDPKIQTLIELLQKFELTTATMSMDSFENLRYIYKDISAFGTKNYPCNEPNVLIYTSKDSYEFIKKELHCNFKKELNYQVSCNVKTIINPIAITNIIFTDPISLTDKQKILNLIQTVGRNSNLDIYRIMAGRGIA